jgi:hypothetical protein
VAEPIVVNTGPLVTFARIGCLDLVGRLPYEFLCPAEVWQELHEGSASGLLGPRQAGSRRHSCCSVSATSPPSRQLGAFAALRPKLPTPGTSIRSREGVAFRQTLKRGTAWT